MTAAERRTAVYRFYGDEGQLLYVGRTAYPSSRFANHRKTKDWFADVADIDVSWHESFAEAAAEEVRAIRNEDPKYNVALPDEDGRFTIGVGRPAYVLPDEATAEAVRRVAALFREWRDAEHPLWAAVADIRPHVPDSVLCEMTGVSRATLNRKLGPRPAGSLGAIGARRQP